MSETRPAPPVPGPDPGAAAGQYDAARTAATVRVLERDLVSVSGSDAEAYLQGQCSQDLAGLVPGGAAEALLLSPQGKIDAFVRVSRPETGGYVIDTDPGFGPVVVARLERFRLRMDVEIAPLEGWACVAVRGPEAAGAVATRSPLILAVDWPGLTGVDLVGPAPEELSDWVGGSAVPCGEEAWEALRIEAGCPVAGRDAVEGSIPAATGLVDRTVSFTKGCYTGQELVARLDARGSKVAHRLCGVVAEPAGDHDADVSPPAGAVVLTADGGHEAGALSSVAWSPGLGADVALAMVHRRVEAPGPILLRWSSSGEDRTRRAEARPLPLAP